MKSAGLSAARVLRRAHVLRRSFLTSDAIVIVEYDPAWPSEFVHLCDCAQAALGDVAIVIEHVGSTAVPGLPAKDVIDMVVVVESDADVNEAISRLEAIGYRARGNLGVEVAKPSRGRKAKGDTTCMSRRRQAQSYKRKWRSAIGCGPIRSSHANTSR